MHFGGLARIFWFLVSFFGWRGDPNMRSVKETLKSYAGDARSENQAWLPVKSKILSVFQGRRCILDTPLRVSGHGGGYLSI